MASVSFNGRILFLADDPAVVEAQLAGRRLTLEAVGTLRDDISTDEITPAASMTAFDSRLAQTPYTGFKAGDRLPVTHGAIVEAGISVVVGGKRYGKGSSREQSPLSEKYAGVKLVIAESFERIYRQNADNVGLFTSTDFGLIERLQRGEAIAVDELVAGRDKVAAGILRAGGILPYGRRHLAAPSVVEMGDDSPLTLTEKILRRRAVATDDDDGAVVSGNGIFVRPDWRFVIEMYSGMASHLLETVFGPDLELFGPETIIGFAEHLPMFSRSPASRIGDRLAGMEELYRLHEQFCAKHGIVNHGRLPGRPGSEGICHPIMTERYALPGQLIVGTDSHTPHAGALGCIAFGVGTSDIANAMVTGAARLTVPDSLLVEVNGTLPAGVSAKDLVLHLLAEPKLKAGGGLGKVFEFAGPAIKAMSIDERATLTNMAAELGGFTGIVAPDEETVRFLKERRGVDFELGDWMYSDPDARYADTIRIDASSLSPIVARPGDPGNGIPLSAVAERPSIDIAFGGTCTGGKREDFDAYHTVLAWARGEGRKVAPGVELYLQFGTLDVRAYCERQGYIETFEWAGAELLMPACGACANLGPGASERSDQVTVSAQNRNFPGRSGPGQVWLASPETVAASAIAGSLCSFAELQTGMAMVT